MELNPIHREGLLIALEKAETRLDIIKATTKSFASKGNEEMVQFSEIDEFLLGKQIELIKQSLIDNEIDF